MKIDSRRLTIELENERVRVLRLNLEPNGVVPQHDANTGVLTALTEVHIRLLRPDKKFQDIHMTPGQVKWLYADTHSIVNLSPTKSEALLIEPKDQPKR